MEAVVLLLELLDDLRQAVGALAGLEAVPDALLADGLQDRQVLLLYAHGKEYSRYSVTFMAGVLEPEHSRMTSIYFDGNSFIITPPFSPSAICVTSGGTCLPASSQRESPLAS